MDEISQPPKRTPHKEQFWKDAVASWKASGLSQSAFCKQEGHGLSSFNKWKKILEGRDNPNGQSTKKKSKFVPVEVEQPPVAFLSAASVIEVTLPNKLTIKLPHDMSPLQVVPLIEALSGVRC